MGTENDYLKIRNWLINPEYWYKSKDISFSRTVEREFTVPHAQNNFCDSPINGMCFKEYLSLVGWTNKIFALAKTPQLLMQWILNNYLLYSEANWPHGKCLNLVYFRCLFLGARQMVTTNGGSRYFLIYNFVSEKITFLTFLIHCVPWK